MKKIITLFFAVTLTVFATELKAQSDPRGLNRYHLTGEQSELDEVFTLPAYDYSEDFFDGFNSKTATELGLVGEVFYNEFGDHAEKGILDAGAVIRFKNGFQWQEAYLEGCVKGGKPYFNRVFFPNKKIASADENNMSSKTYTIPTGLTSLTINNYNNSSATANPVVTANPTATATNTPAKVGYVDSNEDPGVVTPKPKPKYHCPYCGYVDCDGSCYEEEELTTTTKKKKNSGCSDCGVVYQQKTTPGQKLNNMFNTLGNMAGGTGQLLDGVAAIQGKKGVKVYNQIINNLPDNDDDDDDGGDGGQLPEDDTEDDTDSGDGGNLPQKKTSNGLR